MKPVQIFNTVAVGPIVCKMQGQTIRIGSQLEIKHILWDLRVLMNEVVVRFIR